MQILDELKKRIRDRLPDLDVVIGWERGFDPLRVRPLFIKTPEDVDRLVVGPLCVHNLATYLTGFRDRKVGVVVKGCDSRSVVELLQEKLIDRDNVVIFGVPCSGVVSVKKIGHELGTLDYVESVDCADDTVTVSSDGMEQRFLLADVAADKCGRCAHHTPLLSDEMVGEPVAEDLFDGYADVVEFEEKSLDDRREFWVDVMDRCVRCYACRNACPLCVCRDHCVAQSRDPHWMTQEDTVRNKLLFQIIHTVHLAGRCTGCGECERACPMSIPLLLLRRKMNQEINTLFEYDAGTRVNAVPPLLAFKVEEENITERGW